MAATAPAIALLLALVVRPAEAQQRWRDGADSVKVTALAAERVGDAGEYILVPVVFDHAHGFHSWPNEPVVPEELRGLTPIPTTIDVIELPAGAEFERIDWPVPEPVRVDYIDGPLEVLSFTGADTAVVIVRAGSGSVEGDGAEMLRFAVEYQACDQEICYPPTTVELEVLEPGR